MEGAYELDPPLEVDVGVGDELAGGEVSPGHGQDPRSRGWRRVVVGGLIALQAPINSGLGKATGTFPAAAISFAVGTAVLVAIVVVSRPDRRDVRRRRRALVLPDRRPARAPPT